MTDGSIVAAKRADGELHDLTRAEFPRLVGLLALYVGNVQTAEDLAQEALIRLHQHWPRVRAMDSPRAWLTRVAMNLASSSLRRTYAERRARSRVERRRPAALPESAEVLAIRDAGMPYRTGPVRFAVGSPHGLSSNSWRFWTTRTGDAYLACRDNFQNMKVSLHVSGRWRMAFTEEAVKDNPALVPPEADRAWEVWDEPPPFMPDAVAAFSLIFLTSELAVEPSQRDPRKWEGTTFIEAAPADSGKLTAVTLFITLGDRELRHASEPSFRLASLDLIDGRRAQLLAHADPELDQPQKIVALRQAVAAAAEEKSLPYPPGGYVYFFGKHSDGRRSIVGARATPAA